MSSKHSKSGFLKKYRLERNYALKPDTRRGRPGIYIGYSPENESVLVKVWRRRPDTNDQDLAEIWRYELRQLHRLAGYPGSTDCIAHLRDAGYDSHGFYLVFSTGQRQPLQMLIDTSAPNHWIKTPTLPANRVRIWRNLGRLAEGLEILHSQSLLHRNLDLWAALTSGSEEPDFQLTGFEWSMRIVGGATTVQHSQRPRGILQNSFMHDWSMFGNITAYLLGVNEQRIYDLSIPSHEVAANLIAEEVQLLRNIIQVQPVFPLDGQLITSRINNIVQVLAAEITNRSPKYHIAFRLGVNSPLADKIRPASDYVIETDDIDAQLDFVEADLGDSPMLLAVPSWSGGEDFRLILRGKKLTYRLQEFRQVKRSDTTWDLAFCDGIEDRSPAPVNVLHQRVIEHSSLELMTLSSANTRFPRLRGKLRSWEELRREFLRGAAILSPQQITHRALALLQFLEALYSAAYVFPVEIVQNNLESSSDMTEDHELYVRCRADSDRDDLSSALALKAPAYRLEEELKGDKIKPEGWILSDRKSIGDAQPSDTEWRFKKIVQDKGQADIYLFTGPEPPPLLHNPFLVPEGFVGDNKQYKRRLKALRALEEHWELLTMITDPRYRIVDSHDPLIEDDVFAALDESKQEAFKEIISTLPFYLVQGPPGVGKTRLVRDLVAHRFAEDPTSRLLLTAQSNAAVDHLMDELGAIIDSTEFNSPLIVRCSGKDKSEIASEFDLRLQSRQLLKRFAESSLSHNLPEDLANILHRLSECIDDDNEQTPAGTIYGRSINQAFRTFEGAVARAANVVFATTNSAELERLIEERAQCDWTIVEEAGKATGPELISPLLLSHRRLMIGDHKQLPPFAADLMIRLLESPEAVQQALKVGNSFVGPSLRDTATEEILDELEDDKEYAYEKLPQLCAEALRLFSFFETTIESEFDRQLANTSGRPIARKLTEQHRMSPEIANLVSKCFYSNELQTHTTCRDRFNTTQVPFLSTDTERLPIKPIVVIDMPYVQAAIGKDCGEYPRWHNPSERQAVLEVLKLLTPIPTNNSFPTLAILSPYLQQASRLENDIQNSNVAIDFCAPSSKGAFCHTVDSFQGSEADVVIVSLVRNNGHSNIRNAFGFLCDSRRVNVLLSRARWQLILIGSLEFLREVVSANTLGDNSSEIQFMKTLLSTLDERAQRKAIAFIPFDQLRSKSKEK